MVCNQHNQSPINLNLLQPTRLILYLDEILFQPTDTQSLDQHFISTYREVWRNTCVSVRSSIIQYLKGYQRTITFYITTNQPHQNMQIGSYFLATFLEDHLHNRGHIVPLLYHHFFRILSPQKQKNYITQVHYALDTLNVYLQEHHGLVSLMSKTR